MGVRFLPGPFLFHSFSGKIQQSLSDIAVAPPEVLDYNFDLAVRQGGFFTNYLFQFARILAFCFLGEVCHAVLPLPVPASVYGLVLLLLALNFRLIQLEDVKEVGVFLTGIFPLLFVPAAAGVMELWAEMGEMLLPHPHRHHPGHGSGHGDRRKDHPGSDQPQKEQGDCCQ